MDDVLSIRSAVPAEAVSCAKILNEWIDARDWMPRVHTHAEVVSFYQDFVFAKREVFVAGDPVAGFLALDADADVVTALYVAKPGQGIGKQLLDYAKRGKDALELWTFQANDGARRFYAREGFHQVKETAGDNEENLPDVLLRWAGR